MSVIELGDVTAGRPPDAEVDRIRPRSHRLGAALAGLSLLVCAGSAPVAEPGVRLLWSTGMASESNVMVSGDTALLVRAGERTGITAYRLTDGNRLWNRDLPGSLAGFRVTPGGGPVLLSVEPPAGPEPVARTTIALRADTGEQIWQRPGEVHTLAVDDDSTLLIRYDGRGGILGLARVRLADGTPYWDRPVSAVQEVAVESDHGRPTRLVTNSPTGQLTVLRYTDAAVLTERRIPGLTTEPAVGRYVTLQAEGGRLLVLHSDGERTYSAAYDLQTLTEIPRIGSGADISFSCGVVICGHAAADMVALDPETGRELWRYPDVAGISVIGSDRMLIDVQGGGEHVLVESRSGRVLADGLRGSVATDYARPDSLLLLNPTATPQSRTSVASLDLRTGERALLGVVASIPDQQRCQSAPGYLVCEGPGRLVVAAVPR